jgi:hypothetical protein
VGDVLITSDLSHEGNLACHWPMNHIALLARKTMANYWSKEGEIIPQQFRPVAV